MYLNVVNYGDGCYGIEAASRDYFGKSAKDLTLSEAALLVGVPQSPNANNPREHYDAALKRRVTVLNRMLSNDALRKGKGAVARRQAETYTWERHIGELERILLG